MKKITALTLSMVFAVACSSSGVKNFTQYEPLKDELKDAPKWVYSEVGDYEAKASAKIIYDDLELARTEATMKARVKLAERIKSYIRKKASAVMKKHRKSKSAGLKEKMEIIIEDTTNMALIDVKEKALWISKNGNVWVLLKANPEIVNVQIENALAKILGTIE